MTAQSDLLNLPDAHLVASSDSVAVALKDLAAGLEVMTGGRRIALKTGIGKGHKFALAAIATGQSVIKYGWPIGLATQPIAPGEHVHSHNLKSALTGEERYVFEGAAGGRQIAPDTGGFQGYRRATGQVGTRNEIWVIATVGCVATVCHQIALRASARLSGPIDGVHAITHPFGCSQLGDDLNSTRTILAALAAHPNAGGVVLVGLGCESNQLADLLAAVRTDKRRVRTVLSQAVGDEIEAGVEAVLELAEVIANDKRETCSSRDLVLGLKCGGSDGFSGLSANPLLGATTDRVTAAGGSAILTEIPEIFGAERILMSRALSRETFEALGEVVNDFKRYFIDHGCAVDENPSPGNKAGGITTLEEKSLGAVQKAGSAPVADVIRYGQRLRRPGLTLLESPGNDAVSSTALAAAGANIILFTTGRGTPLGFPAPTIKIASNSDLAERKPNWIDFDAGAILVGLPLEKAADQFLDLLRLVASGRPTWNEKNGERTIALWKRGVTL